MDKKPLHLGLYRGPPRYTSEEAVREQLRQMPKLVGPSIATRLVQRSKAPQANATPRQPDIEPDTGKTPL
jgi:hypothetical protein